MREAALIFHTKLDFRGNLEQITCEWEGPKDGVLSLGRTTLDVPIYRGAIPPKVGDTVSVGPFNLKVVEYEGWRDFYRLVRTDSLLGQTKVIAYRLTRWLDLIYRRLIITASIWRLAEYRPECYPSWEDLYLCKWVLRKNADLLNAAIRKGWIDENNISDKKRFFVDWRNLCIIQRLKK